MEHKTNSVWTTVSIDRNSISDRKYKDLYKDVTISVLNEGMGVVHITGIKKHLEGVISRNNFKVVRWGADREVNLNDETIFLTKQTENAMNLQMENDYKEFKVIQDVLTSELETVINNLTTQGYVLMNINNTGEHNGEGRYTVIFRFNPVNFFYKKTVGVFSSILARIKQEIENLKEEAKRETSGGTDESRKE